MKIIIEITDEEYEDVKKAGGCYYDFGKAIYYGTPLPKGHGDLIDRNEAEKIADKMFEHITSPLLNHIQTYDAYNIIRLTPAVIKAESEEWNMYKAQRFDSIYDLKDFLNENEIKPTEIIKIYRVPSSPYDGLYDLLYYVKDTESEE